MYWSIDEFYEQSLKEIITKEKFFLMMEFLTLQKPLED